MALDPAVCRAQAMARFDRSIIVTQYVDLYRLVINEWLLSTSRPEQAPMPFISPGQEPTIVTVAFDHDGRNAPSVRGVLLPRHVSNAGSVK